MSWFTTPHCSVKLSCLYLQVEPTYNDVACALEAWNLRALLATSGAK